MSASALRPHAARQAFRMHTYLRAELYIPDPVPAVLTDLSGTGAQLYIEGMPADFDLTAPLRLDLHLPAEFVAEQARRRTAARPAHRRWVHPRPFMADELYARAGESLRRAFRRIEAQPLQALPGDTPGLCRFSVAFARPHEGCFRLVRHLERRTLQNASAPQPSLAA